MSSSPLVLVPCLVPAGLDPTSPATAVWVHRILSPETMSRLSSGKLWPVLERCHKITKGALRRPLGRQSRRLGRSFPFNDHGRVPLPIKWAKLLSSHLRKRGLHARACPLPTGARRGILFLTMALTQRRRRRKALRSDGLVTPPWAWADLLLQHPRAEILLFKERDGLCEEAAAEHFPAPATHQISRLLRERHHVVGTLNF